MSRSNVMAYAGWHLRDAVPRLMTPLLLFLFLAGIPLWSMVSEVGLSAVQTDGPSQQGALQAYRGVLPMVITLGAIIVVTGGVALDRERQYFRFLFSQPVVPWQFYLLRFVVGLLAFSLLMMLIPLGVRMLFADVPILAVGRSSLVYGLIYGGLALLCAALVNRDGVLFIGSIVVITMLQQTREILPAWLGHVADALPPLTTVDNLRSAWLAGRPADLGDLTLVVGYSVAMLAVALFLIRRAPLAR